MESFEATEIKRHFNVVAEGWRIQIDRLADAVSRLHATVERIETLLASSEKGFERILADLTNAACPRAARL
jgi:hypothetical protein